MNNQIQSSLAKSDVTPWAAGVLIICALIGIGASKDLSSTAVWRADDGSGAWPVYGGADGGAKFSELTQINRDNVGRLEQAWSYSVGEWSGAPGQEFAFSLQTTPILVDDMLVGCTHMHRVFAIDAETGVERWVFDPQLEPSPQGLGILKCKGVAVWEDASRSSDSECKKRIILGASLSVFALDARTGRVCEGFGREGRVAVKADGLEFHDEVQLRSPPVIVGDVAVFGSTLRDIYRKDSPSGKVRAFDVRTGAVVWEYDPIPRDANDPAHATWGEGSTDYVGSANVWTLLSADPENDLVFLPTSSPAADFYGAHRPGDNQWSTSLVAVRGSTGEQVWAFQTTHHDLWDSDLPAQPILVDLLIDGRETPVVILLTKQSFVFVFDRLTGEPIHEIVEQPVPQETDVPGEWISPTQPFPTVIPPLSRIGLEPDDAWGLTPFDRGACRKLIEQYRNDGLFTPPSLQGTILMPSGAGGMNWGGGAVIAQSQTLIVPVFDMPAVVKLVPKPGEVEAGVIQKEGGGAEEAIWPMKGTPYTADLQFLTSPLGAPCSAPPWASMVAVNLVNGEIKWRTTLGTIENLKWFAPPLRWGAAFSGGPIATAGGLAFMAGTTDRRIRAFDVETGEVVWRAKLPAGGMATPMTYAVNGRQYLVVAAGGSNIFPGPMGDDIVAYALPNSLIRDPDDRGPAN
ncbi:MAG: pyrroloquinoline quinone-dependent dehydrogenase [Pseudomonadota bacterium]